MPSLLLAYAHKVLAYAGDQLNTIACNKDNKACCLENIETMLQDVGSSRFKVV